MSNNEESTVLETSYEEEPSLYKNIVAIWHGMYEKAEDRHEGRIYEGRLTNLFHDTGVSTGQYSPVTKHMQKMGCAIKMRRGGGGHGSIWQLVTEPTLAQFNETKEQGFVPRGESRLDSFEAMIDSLGSRLNKVEHLTAILMSDKQRRDRANG